MNSMVRVLLCTSSSGGMANSASASWLVGAADLARRGLDGGEQRAVHHELDVAQLRQQAGREGVVDVDLGGPDHVRLRQREVDVVAGCRCRAAQSAASRRR